MQTIQKAGKLYSDTSSREVRGLILIKVCNRLVQKYECNLHIPTKNKKEISVTS